MSHPDFPETEPDDSVNEMAVRAGWTDDLDFAFRHRAEICKPFTRKYTDPEAPYDGYIEDDDTEEKARTIRLAKKRECR